QSPTITFGLSPSLRGALATKRSRLLSREILDCFAPLAMTENAELSRAALRAAADTLPRHLDLPHGGDLRQRAGVLGFVLGLRGRRRAGGGVREALLHLAQEAVERVDAGSQLGDLGKFGARGAGRLARDVEGEPV